VVRPGDVVSVSVVITNRGGTAGTFPVSLKINGITEDSREIALSPGASQTVGFSTSRVLSGSYTMDIAGLSAAFSVEAEPEPDRKGSTASWWVVAAVIFGGAMVTALVIAARRRRAAAGGES
jgi:predicted benzoate:H+ symporter BenE